MLQAPIAYQLLASGRQRLYRKEGEVRRAAQRLFRKDQNVRPASGRPVCESCASNHSEQAIQYNMNLIYVEILSPCRRFCRILAAIAGTRLSSESMLQLYLPNSDETAFFSTKKGIGVSCRCLSHLIRASNS